MQLSKGFSPILEELLFVEIQMGFVPYLPTSMNDVLTKIGLGTF
jgi:hypothetical protein